AIKALDMGYNIGIAGTDKDGLVIIDVDDEIAFKDHDFIPTLTARSSSRNGRHHFYFTFDPKCKVNIPLEKKGELRSDWQYVVAPGSWANLTDSKDDSGNVTKSKEEKYNSLSDTEKPFVGKYTLETIQPPALITFNEIPAIFKDEKTLREQKESVKQNRPMNPFISSGNNGKSALFELTIDDVITSIPDRGRHPSLFHDSHTGKNTSISNGLLHCWGHNVSHNAISALAVMSGLYHCVDAGIGHQNSGAGSSDINYDDPKTVYNIWNFAKKNGNIPLNDPIPAKALTWYAIKNNLCKESDLTDGWKLPVILFKEIKNILNYDETKTVMENTPVKNIIKKEYSYSDYGNARRLLDKFGENLRYCVEMKEWYIWDSTRWNLDAEGKINQYAKKTILGLYELLNKIEDVDRRKQFFNFILKCENQNKLKTMIESATNEPGIPISINELDKDLDLINVSNGIIELKTGNLIPHNKEKLMSRKIELNYNSDAKCDRFQKFLNEIFPENPEVILFLQWWFGYSL
ncbi:MAG: bifunctional DNA primase/polymerase, partial [Desulfobacterales bacterium]|nr:bifunctional DNA primase/polymerase [Desulfobacterales bacterium]